MAHDSTGHGSTMLLPASALVSLLRSKTLADLIDPRVEPPGASDPLMRFAEFWNVIEIVIESTASRATFRSREDARERLFAYAPGGGFGIPIVIQDLVLSHLAPAT